jgi:hypothetical protein
MARFTLGDQVLHRGVEKKVTAVGPRHPRSGDESWYGLSDGPFFDAFERDLEHLEEPTPTQY